MNGEGTLESQARTQENLDRQAEADFIRSHFTPLQSEATLYNLDNLQSLENPTQSRLTDEFANPTANLNTPTSLVMQTKLYPQKLSYQELSILSTDPYISRVIDIKSRDIVGNKGEFVVVGKHHQGKEIIESLENELKRLKFWNLIYEASVTAFNYGGALLYLEHRGILPSEVFPIDFDSYRNVKIDSIVVVPPVYATGLTRLSSDGKGIDPLSPFITTPPMWSIGGHFYSATQVLSYILINVDKTRSFFYNYLGRSLIENIAPSLRKFYTVYESAVETLLKQRVLQFKSNLMGQDNQRFASILESMKYLINNQSIVGTTLDDEFVSLVSPLQGLSDMIREASQQLCSVAGVPATKLLGYSPLGLNNTGEYDLKTYYDEIEGFQKTHAQPIIIEIAQRLVWSLGYDVEIDFTFTPIAQESNKEREERETLITNKLATLVNLEIITPQQAFQFAKNDGIIPEHEQYDDSLDSPDDQSYSELESLAQELSREQKEASNGY